MDLQRSIIQGITHLFFPRLCEGCGQPLIRLEEVLCLSCNLSLPRTSYHNVAGNETALRFAGRLPFQQATSYAYFTTDGLLQQLLHLLKYKNRKEIGWYLGKQFGNDLSNAAWIKDINSIVPVPLHVKKQAKRGFNQATLIAEGMSDVLNIPCDQGVLIRTKYTETQTRKTREERVNNMQAAFAIKDQEKLAGKHILLVDDVLTTGATLEAAAATLLSIPRTKLSIATVGIVV